MLRSDPPHGKRRGRIFPQGVSPEPPALLAQPATRGRITPIWAVFTFTFFNSIGTGVVTNGVVYLTKHGYGFSDALNYWLAVLMGVTYIVGALGAQPLIAWVRAVVPGASSRAILGAMMLVMALLCVVPQAALWLQGGEGRSSWPIWLVVALYSPLTGVLWPMVESYLSGGRSGAPLRKVVGRWNIVWSSAVVAAYFGIAPFVERAPAGTVLALGAVHLGCWWLLTWFSRDPAPHDPEEHEPHPPVYYKLLVTFRLLLPMSYVVSSALGPYLPSVMTRMRVNDEYQTIIASAWLAPRVLMFFVLDRWQGWHGRWFPAVAGGVLLVGGFAVTVFADRAPTQGWFIAVLAVGLALFGVGMAVVYSGAIYYAMEVGQSEVQAGGKHEALIGMGYTVGPVVLLTASMGVERGWIESAAFEPVVLGFVGALAVIVAGLVVYRVLAHVKTPQNGAQ